MADQPVDATPSPAADAAPASAEASPVLQDWAPLTHCLDWHLGQLAFQQRGAQAFTTNEVPNLINQGGMSAYRAAEVLYANCAEADAAGELEDEIVGMEIAMGLGLHSVQLLDRFKERCAATGKDWYERLTWYATDATPKMLTDARDNGVFERHSERVVLAQADALAPATVHPIDGSGVVDLTGRLRMVSHTYLLCVLPANVFRRSTARDGDAEPPKDRWSVLMARTVLRHPEGLARFTNVSVDQVRALAASRAADDLSRLVPLYPLFDLDLTLAPLADQGHSDRAELERVADLIEASLDAEAVKATDEAPDTAADTAADTADPEASAEAADAPDPHRHTWVLHSAGAMASVASTLAALRPDGFLLYRDYGPSAAASANSSHLYQHYGSTTAIGVNHFALDSWVSLPGEDGSPRGTSTAPEGEGESAIKTRLVAKAALDATRAAFRAQFDPAAFVALQQAVEAARKAARDPNAAMEGYRQALAMERDNWVLLAEAADYALRRARNLELARMLVTEALRINPWYGAPAWNCLGDVHWFDEKLDASQACFERATRANPEHFKGWFNLYLVHRRRGDLETALEMAAKALAVDRGGADAARLEAAVQDATALLAKQRELGRTWRKKRAAGSPV